MTTLVKVSIWLAIAIVALWAIDTLLLWAEGRGWIFYRRNKPTRGALGNAFLEINGIIDQGKKVILREMKKTEHDESHSGDPANPDARSKRPTRDK
jgi:hypothetical protein